MSETVLSLREGKRKDWRSQWAVKGVSRLLSIVRAGGRWAVKLSYSGTDSSIVEKTGDVYLVSLSLSHIMCIGLVTMF